MAVEARHHPEADTLDNKATATTSNGVVQEDRAGASLSVGRANGNRHNRIPTTSRPHPESKPTGNKRKTMSLHRLKSA